MNEWKAEFYCQLMAWDLGLGENHIHEYWREVTRKYYTNRHSVLDIQIVKLINSN